MIGLFIFLTTGLAILWIAGVLLVVWIITHPTRRTYAGAVARGRPGEPSELPDGPAFEAWTFSSRGLSLPVWDIRGQRRDGPTVIMTHGWGDSRLGGLVRAPAVLPHCSRLVLWDLPGHGEAPGLCRLGTSEVDDLCALIERVGGTNIVLMGWSLGAGTCIAAAARQPGLIKAIIAETPYRLARTPAANVARSIGLPTAALMPPGFAVLRVLLGRGILSSAFDRAKLASSLRIPVLVIHGTEDEICPIQDGRDIAAACHAEMIEVTGGRHNDLWSNPLSVALLTTRVGETLRSCGP